MVHVDGAKVQCLGTVLRQSCKQRRGINTAAERYQDVHIWKMRQQGGQPREEPAAAKGLPRRFYSEPSEKTPKEEIFAERAARSSSRGNASS